MCNCHQQPDLVEISNKHAEFKSSLRQMEVGNWVYLMSCPDCGQLWKVDEWDKYQTVYAVKLSEQQNWESFDIGPLIKKRVEASYGLGSSKCMQSGCNKKQLRGKAFCVDHLYAGGTRA